MVSGDVVYCPQCGGGALTKTTRYGRRDECPDCGLWSWDGKPLVSREVHDARKLAHAAFDTVWKNADEAYGDPPANGKARRNRRRAMRNRAYAMLSELTGLPEPECHMASQDDLHKLDLIRRCALTMTPAGVRQWAKREDRTQPTMADVWPTEGGNHGES